MARLIIKLLCLGLLCPQIGWAQWEGLVPTFPGTRIVNGHSVETSQKGDATFIISHRFGRISDGIDEFFGFDNSTIRIGMDYGITNGLMIGIGRSSFQKTIDGYVKLRLMRQRKGGTPISLTAFQSIAINTAPFPNPNLENLFSSRLSYSTQILVARRFGERFSLQLMPTLVHRNLVNTAAESNDVYAIGIAPRVQATKQWAFSVEYYYVLPDQLTDEYHNSVSLGIEYETKGHVFHFTLSTSRGMIEKFFVAETTGDLSQGELHLGFNITRDFRVKGRQY